MNKGNKFVKNYGKECKEILTGDKDTHLLFLALLASRRDFFTEGGFKGSIVDSVVPQGVK